VLAFPACAGDFSPWLLDGTTLDVDGHVGGSDPRDAPRRDSGITVGDEGFRAIRENGS
jgi:hypothetical protein